MDTPNKRIQQLKQVVLEWVVTNGSLPGFEDRVQSSKHLWSVVGEEGMMVYRGQGHSINGIPNHGEPSTLLNGVRPIIATTKSRDVAQRYMGKECCLFEIQVEPGIRYVDTNKLFTFPDFKTGAMITNVSNDTIDQLLQLAENMNDGYWIKKAIRAGNGRDAVRRVFLKRIREEHEIILDSAQGGFTVTPHIFKARYTPKGGRGRTLRRSSKRSNKNGYRSTRKSQCRRNGKP